MPEVDHRGEADAYIAYVKRKGGLTIETAATLAAAHATLALLDAITTPPAGGEANG